MTKEIYLFPVSSSIRDINKYNKILCHKIGSIKTLYQSFSDVRFPLKTKKETEGLNSIIRHLYRNRSRSICSLNCIKNLNGQNIAVHLSGSARKIPRKILFPSKTHL